MVKISNVTQEKQWRKKLNVKSMGNGGLPTCMGKEIKDKYNFWHFLIFHQDTELYKFILWRHIIFTIDCLLALTDRNIILAKTEKGIMVRPGETTASTWTCPELLFGRDAFSSGFRLWLHNGITWGIFKKTWPGPTPNIQSYLMWTSVFFLNLCR